ncbi:ABCA9 protein, partial [Eudromia elegans]|nr:ABCA9 protein [Eudromia elegans]
CVFVQVLIQAADAPSPGQASAGFLGRCPQENPLWPELTVQEHLEVYGAVRGMRSEDVAASISRIAEALELQKHLKTEVRRLSMGEARKVSFVLSMLGDPTVLLWDEPSVGMDPKGQRRMRKAIRTVLKSKERGAVLSTHHLDEALATCDRVAVLVSGQLRYIGPVEDLRRQLGQSYYLEVTARDAGRGGAFHAEVLRLFPSAAQQESSSSLLVYKIPTENVLPLSQSFAKLEAGKRKERRE